MPFCNAVRWLSPVLLAVLPFSLQSQTDEAVPPEQGCTFKANPDEFVSAQARARSDVFERVRKYSFRRDALSAVQAAASLPRRNFIDDEIFGQLEKAGVSAAPLTTDEQFIRRIYLDLTGRIPAAREVRDFVADQYKGKRDDLIEKLLSSQEFADKWGVWFADLLQSTESLSTSNRRPQIEGRNSFGRYLRDAVSLNKPVRDIAIETITGTGNNYFTENGPANFAVLASVAMGPIQDTYDMMLVRSATAFLGMAHYDCVLCHNGRGHLDQLSSWGARTTRIEAWSMAAHFSRMRLNNGAPGSEQYKHVLYNSTDVQDAATGTYDLNTTFGNRPERCQFGQRLMNGRCPQTGNLRPEYRDGTAAPATGSWRMAFAQKLVQDPMFGRNFANRLWKAFFGLGLVDPVDTLDPDRLDPKNPPAGPWTLQASHPELLEKLKDFFFANNTDLRRFVRLLVQSSAYQLSSGYDAPWKYEYTSLFVRHYPRRLIAEEVHDAIAKSTGVFVNYTWPIINGQTIAQGTAATQSEPVQWAMQLPDINEPRTNGAVLNFLNSFTRGNRDTTPRNQNGSILQQLNLMNDAFVVSRIKVAASPALKEMLKLQDNRELIDEMFLTFLSRLPTGQERETALAFLNRATTVTARSTAVEDLAWAAVNKLDFLFSY